MSPRQKATIAAVLSALGDVAHDLGTLPDNVRAFDAAYQAGYLTESCRTKAEAIRTLVALARDAFPSLEPKKEIA